MDHTLRGRGRRESPHATKTRENRRARSGFTLIEVAIAVAVLTIGLLGAAAAIVNTVHLSKESRDANAAAQQLQTVVEWVQGTPYTNLTTVFPAGTIVNAGIPKRLPSETITISYFYYDVAGNEVVLPAIPPVPFPSQLQYRLSITWKRSSDGKITPAPTARNRTQTVTGVRTASE